MSVRVGLRHFSRVLKKLVAMIPPAWNYDDVVGKIWLEDPGKNGYDNSHTGQIEVREPTGLGLIGEMQGGTYDNRT